MARKIGEYGDFTPHTRYYDGMVMSQRDRYIIEMRRRGYKLWEIAAALNMSISGVSDAVRRIRARRPGRDPRDCAPRLSAATALARRLFEAGVPIQSSPQEIKSLLDVMQMR
jgi:DNA-binding CsgD family transcriptional regulator